MKKVFVILLFILSYTAQANIMPEVYVYISELYFNDDKWLLEVGCFQHNPEEFPIDSIEIRSSTDTITYSGFVLPENESLLVITQDSLKSNFSISDKGDVIEILAYTKFEAIPMIMGYTYLKFGTYPESMIKAPGTGESIIQLHFEAFDKYYDQYHFAICSKPSIGSNNNVNDAYGTIRGIIYNNKNQPQTNGEFWLNHSFKPNSKGEFEFFVGAYSHNHSEITYKQYIDHPDYNGYFEIKFADIKELSFDLQPGDIIEQDIFLTEAITTDILEYENNTSFRVFPNPIRSVFQIELNEQAKYSNIDIQIMDIEGKEIMLINKEIINKCSIELNSDVKPGIYILNIINNNSTIHSEKILVNPF